MAGKDVVRFALEMSPKAATKLEEMSEEAHVSKGQIVLRALAILEVAMKAHREGRPFGVGKDGQELGTEIVGL